MSTPSFHAAVGSSQDPDGYKAGHWAASVARSKSPGGKLALVLASYEYDPSRVVAGVTAALGSMPFVGGTTAGAIAGSTFQERAVSVVVMGGDFDCALAVSEYAGCPRRAAVAVARACASGLEGRDAQVAFVFCSTESGEGTEVVATLKEEMGQAPLLYGGGSGFDLTSPGARAHQFSNGEVVTCGVALLTLSFRGPGVRVVTAVSHGLQPISNPMVVTRAEGHYVHEVNGEPVFHFYEKYLGKPVEDVGDAMLTYPFLVEVPGHSMSMARVPYFMERDRSRIGFLPIGDMAGQTVSLAHFSRNEIVRACRESAYKARILLKDHKPAFIFPVSCAARQMFLGSRVAEEAQIIEEVFGTGVPTAGYYSTAEIAPFKSLAPGASPILSESDSQIVCETFCLLVVGDLHARTGSFQGISGRFATQGERPAVPGEALKLADEEVARLKAHIEHSESVLEIREQVLMKINQENIEITQELKAANLHLSELNQKNNRLQRIIRQYTPQTTWRKAGKLVDEGKLEIPDETASLTYMFLDVKGFTSFSETHRPEEVIQALNVIFVPATNAIYANGGDIHKFIGDAIFAIFDTPPDALRAALAIQKEISQVKTVFTVRIGIHAGRSVHGNVGSDYRRDNTLIGDAVNITQRLESSCTPGRILISREVYDSVEGTLSRNAQPRQITVKGKSQPLDVFEIDPTPLA